MKHNGLANLFLGIIYGVIFNYIHMSVEAPASIGLMITVALLLWMFTWFLYDMAE